MTTKLKSYKCFEPVPARAVMEPGLHSTQVVGSASRLVKAFRKNYRLAKAYQRDCDVLGVSLAAANAKATGYELECRALAEQLAEQIAVTKVDNATNHVLRCQDSADIEYYRRRCAELTDMLLDAEAKRARAEAQKV